MVVQAIRRASGHAVLRPHRLLVGAAGLVLLTGCVEEETRFVSAPEATFGSDIAGELTSSSLVNLNNGTRYSAHWLCAGATAGQGQSYALEAPFAAELSAFDSQGQWLGSARGGPEAGPLTLLAAPADDACMLVVVNGRGQDAFGPYRLGAEPIGTQDELVPGRALTGRLDGDATEYPIRLDGPALLSLSLSGVDDLGLQLEGSGVSQSAHACATGELRLEAYLDAGDYRVRLRPDHAPAVGGEASCPSRVLGTGEVYRLMAERRDLADGWRNGGPLRNGDSVSGTLKGAAPNAYSLHLDGPSEISLSLRSRAFDTVLRVTGEGTDIANDDDGNGTDSRLDTVLMAGDYRVEVDSYGEGDGDYALELTRRDFDGEFRNEGALALGESLRGQLTGLSESRYRLAIDEPVEVRLALDSQDFDPMLRLHGNGLDLSDDDSGGDRNALITTILQPGEYVLEAQSYSGSGIYRLRTEGQAFEGRTSDGGEVRPGETVYGNLGGGSLAYELVIDEARPVVVEATSAAVDTMLRLSGRGVDAQNDDAGDLGLGSRITQHLEPGTYRVEVNSFGSGTGMVRLEIGG
ncbi:hypothetical protein [Halomonas nitroreducens]|uniref:ABC transporter substrate-binding protein n=1 Tax=Halomonas nitroreducens TaxID=447425 RepID=A0A431UYR0_9GAMM|nr:hypothetical protein [Halomonas nitroreducens]RTQ98221.1 hypothetical protein EKG36_19395 [Halomonas nitroreducens]